jgi:steroid 5-alpha reductase family enzyme
LPYQEKTLDFLQLYLTVGLVILGFMTLLWLVSLALKNSSIVDIFWGTGFVIVTWVAFVLTPDGFALRKWLLNVLVTIWGLRLSLHILARNWGKPEDFRYQVWRKEAGAAWWWRSFFKVFPRVHSCLSRLCSLRSQPSRISHARLHRDSVWVIAFFLRQSAIGSWCA